MSLPVARSKSQFSIQPLEDELVLLDLSKNEYHTLSNKAAEIWFAADGTRSEKDIAELVFGDCSPASMLQVQIGLSELSNAGLLEGDSIAMARFSRRRAGQAAAAAMLGLVGLPLVTSITIPDAAAQTSCFPKLEPEAICVAGDSCRCTTSCCCQRPSDPPFCYDQATCRAAGFPCI